MLMLAAALAGCGRSPDAGESPPIGAEAAAPAQPDPLMLWAARMPDSLTHRAGACPFECCVYGTWTGTGEVPLRAAPLRPRPLVHTIPAGQPFTADSGFVRITGVSLLVLEDTIDLGPTTFGPGDTVAVLDYVGEGYFNVWDGDKVWQVPSFWGQSGASGPDPVETDGQYAKEWWVHATTSDGRRGWLDADSVATLKGADACGG